MESYFERIRMVRMVRMVRSLADRTFQPRSEFDPRFLLLAACLAVVVAVGLAFFEDPRLRQTLLALR